MAYYGWMVSLQPDCNMPSGESIIRQILAGKTYFKTYFEIDTTTAINFDSFVYEKYFYSVTIVYLFICQVEFCSVKCILMFRNFRK
jgi:hypothetical protein